MSSPGTTTRRLPTDGPTAGGDELDDLFDYDAGMDDPFSENYKPPARKETAKEDSNKGRSGAGLGIDEEVEITRKSRAPRVKLDENRLLSAAGITKLRKRAKDHLKFKGRGHEYSDASKLLAFYQLWLDDLFPKAKFLDALAMVEKMGHKKRMQAMRMEWINEGKPRSSVHEDSIFDEPTLPSREGGGREKTAPALAPIFEKMASERPKTPTADVEAEMDDLYNTTPRPTRQIQPDADSQPDSLFGRGSGVNIFGPSRSTEVDDGPHKDDLDALLAEEEMFQTTSANTQRPSNGTKAATPPEDNFDDDMEAMAEMDGMW